MSCKKELDIGCPQVTIIAIEWIFFSEDRKWIELKIRQNSTAKFNQFSWQKLICKIQVWKYSVILCFFLLFRAWFYQLQIEKFHDFLYNSTKVYCKIQSVLITETQNLSLKIFEYSLLFSIGKIPKSLSYSQHDFTNYEFPDFRFFSTKFLFSKRSPD